MSDIKQETESEITNPKYKSYEELSETYIFVEIFTFVRQSTGIALTIAYLTLILSSMLYLYVLYSEFNISIVKYITLEDILATPIKNPIIILVFFAIILLMFIADFSLRFGARVHMRYAKQKVPIWLHLLKPFIYIPKNKKTNTRWTMVLIVFFLALYTIGVASIKADKIKEGGGEKVILQLADESDPVTVTLLGTSAQFVFIYSDETGISSAFHVESVQSIISLPASEPK